MCLGEVLPQEPQTSQFYPGDYSGGGTVWQGARREDEAPGLS
jgi:hypothetical protein